MRSDLSSKAAPNRAVLQLRLGDRSAVRWSTILSVAYLTLPTCLDLTCSVRSEISRAGVRDPAQRVVQPYRHTGNPLGQLNATRAICNSYILDFLGSSSALM
jgi:hypothetical protein